MIEPMTDRMKKAHQACQCLKGIVHPIRLAIVHELREGPRHVNALVEALGVSQSNLSQHLAQMKHAGIVVARREANFVLYEVADSRLFALIDQMKILFCK